MSTPLPNPRHEKGTINEGTVLVANPNASRVQHEGPSVDTTTKGRNTPQPPGIVQPSHIVAVSEPGQGYDKSKQYGAWFSTTGAQRGALSLSAGAP